MVEKETLEIVGQKRRARTCTDTNSGKSSTSASSKEMVAAGGTRRSKRVKVAVKVAPAYYIPAEEESSLDAWSYASSGATRRNTALAAPPPLENNSATDGETTMNGSNEDTNIGSSPRVSDVAAATMVHKRKNVCTTFDERFKDLMAFKAEFGHCNVPQKRSSNNKYRSLGSWCGDMRSTYKAIKEGGKLRRNKLSKADMKRLENAGFEWILLKTFDERFKDLMAFKAEFGHCNVPCTKSSDNRYRSLGQWCSHVRKAYKTIKEGEMPRKYNLSKSDIKRLENAGFEWNFCRKLTFDEPFKDLMAFKAKFGHCNVPCTNSNNKKKYYSLGKWCTNVRRSYRVIQEGGMAICKISKADIKRLEKAGFEWRFK